jgi:hypothetical protein
MKVFNSNKYISALGLLLLVGSTAHATTLFVNCGGKAGLSSIGAALKTLQSPLFSGPNTINVSGACNENIVIKDMDRLTLNAVNNASITDASDGYADVINVNNSPGFTLQGFAIFAINANNDGVNCNNGSHCTLIGNTLQGGFGGVGVLPTATAFIVGGSLQGNTYGLRALGEVIAAGVMIRGNSVGVNVRDGGSLLFRVSDPQYDGVEYTLPAVSQGNQQQGILATRNATVRCQGCTVSGNGAEGINLDLTSSAFVGPYSFNSGAVAGNAITGNTGSGVLVGDLSSATFQGSASNISGNGQPGISCLGQTSVTRRAVATVGVTHTNCTN